VNTSATAANHRWIQNVLVALGITVVVMLSWDVHRVAARQRMAHVLRKSGALLGRVESDQPEKRLPLLWYSFGARPVGILLLPEGQFSERQVAEIAALFPEASIQGHTIRMDMPGGIGDPAR